MASKIIMPKLSDTMTEGVLGVWRKSVGERIERGEIIAEVETDKATMELEAFSSGVLLEQLIKSGEVVTVGTVIGLIGEPAEAAFPLPAENRETLLQHESDAGTSTSAAEHLARGASSSGSTLAGQTRQVPNTLSERSRGVQAAPVVRRRAAELGIDLTGILGSGPQGRVMLEDLQRPAAYGAGKTDSANAEDPAARDVLVEPLSRMRRAIARTTLNAWQSTPHFYLTRNIEMDRALNVVRGFKARGENVSLNAMIMAAVAFGLVRCPSLNTGYCEEGITTYPHVNLAFAVAGNGILQMPVIRCVESMGLREISGVASDLTERARHGLLTTEEISGGSFSVSNLGMFGVDSFASIIAPGQAAILAVGAVSERPVVHEGRLAVARTMTATLSCDHRIVDGSTAAGFLGEFKRILEVPEDLKE